MHSNIDSSQDHGGCDGFDLMRRVQTNDPSRSHERALHKKYRATCFATKHTGGPINVHFAR